MIEKKINPDQIKKLKLNSFEIDPREKYIEYHATIFLPNSSVEVDEKLFFMRKTNLYTNFEFKNVANIKEIINVWANESEYLNKYLCIYIMFEIYKSTDLDIWEFNRYFVEVLNEC